MTSESNDSLVARARLGDEAAFGRLIERHYRLIYRIAWRWSGARADAEDAAQEVCVKLARALHQFRGESAFTTWLTRMTINTAKDMGRARARRRQQVAALALVGGDSCAPAPDGGLEAGDLWRAVNALPDRQRDSVMLVYAEELSHAEAAQVLGCREKTLSWHLHEARKALKERLKD